MVTTMDVREFIKSNGYNELLNKTVHSLSLPLRDGDIPSQVFNIDAGSINKSGVSLNDLSSLYNEDENKIINFIRLHQHEVQDDNDDYYEDDDEENKSVTIEVLPSYKNFLIGYLIKYYLLKNDQQALDTYLKALRIPNYKKYANELKDIYSRL